MEYNTEGLYDHFVFPNKCPLPNAGANCNVPMPNFVLTWPKTPSKLYRMVSSNIHTQ